MHFSPITKTKTTTTASQQLESLIVRVMNHLITTMRSENNEFS
jgi:hypothetical protein